jgi:hypothetical protein
VVFSTNKNLATLVLPKEQKMNFSSLASFFLFLKHIYFRSTILVLAWQRGVLWIEDLDSNTARM